MIPLVEQIEQINKQFELIVDGDKNRIAIDAYEHFSNTFFPVIGKFEDSCAKRTVLKNIPKEIVEQQLLPVNEFNKVLFSTIGALNSLEEKWIEDDYKVTQDDSFDNTVQAMKSLTKMIVVANKEVWNTWTDYLLGSFNRTDAELKNIEKIDKYKNIYNVFIRERSLFTSKIVSLPTQVDEIKELQELSSRLQILMEDVNGNLPEEVTIFLNCIDDVVKGKKAPLSLLTPEVLKWMQDNNEMSSFAITRTSGYR